MKNKIANLGAAFAVALLPTTGNADMASERSIDQSSQMLNMRCRPAPPLALPPGSHAAENMCFGALKAELLGHADRYITAFDEYMESIIGTDEDTANLALFRGAGRRRLSNACISELPANLDVVDERRLKEPLKAYIEDKLLECLNAIPFHQDGIKNEIFGGVMQRIEDTFDTDFHEMLRGKIENFDNSAEGKPFNFNFPIIPW
jgi:hypothetical protein